MHTVALQAMTLCASRVGSYKCSVKTFCIHKLYIHVTVHRNRFLFK